ncbi:MAG: hypothetical protein WBN11_04495 [Eudoraea sp.]|uniref:hypothetical protein n=1 Tax=Eudoraea sp. TaxID=1979955 RepID=UPI003C793DB0
MRKERHWFWNILLVLTLVICIIALIIHYKNWIWEKEASFYVLSGVYYKELPFEKINEISWVDRIPSMERNNGFSAWAREKGVFVDSLKPENKVYVYVDNLNERKLKIIYEDSLLIYINLSDSLETEALFRFLETKISETTKIK